MSDKFSWCADDICDGGSEVIILCYDEVEQILLHYSEDCRWQIN